MTNAYKDENSIPTMIGALDTNGQSITRVVADPLTSALEVDDGSTGTNHGPTNAPRDENGIPALQAVSSADGQTPVTLYVNSLGHLLIDSL